MTNYYKEDERILREEFLKLCAKLNFQADEANISINKYYDKKSSPQELSDDIKWDSLDCENGRILTAKGIYTCPFLANDHRGRCGSTFKDFADKTALETNFCAVCIENKKQFFGINYKLFE